MNKKVRRLIGCLAFLLIIVIFEIIVYTKVSPKKENGVTDSDVIVNENTDNYDKNENNITDTDTTVNENTDNRNEYEYEITDTDTTMNENIDNQNRYENTTDNYVIKMGAKVSVKELDDVQKSIFIKATSFYKEGSFEFEREGDKLVLKVIKDEPLKEEKEAINIDRKKFDVIENSLRNNDKIKEDVKKNGELIIEWSLNGFSITGGNERSVSEEVINVVSDIVSKDTLTKSLRYINTPVTFTIREENGELTVDRTEGEFTIVKTN